MKALVGARILEGATWRDDHALLLNGALIEAVMPVATLDDAIPREALHGGVLLPGFIDTQVNGGGGVLLNDVPTVAGVRAIAEAHRKFGTTGLLPTLISDDLVKVETAIRAVDSAIEERVPGVLGIHLEGPFLNPNKRGIHDVTKFRRLDPAGIALVSSLHHGVTIVTLAPELAKRGAILALVRKGVVVSAGHSMATYNEMQSAFAEGMEAVTHLFNAMTQLESRAPGMVGAALEQGVSGIIV
ncbi:MAG: N-acetylglucosamine-6-phosphate deacetylase, partial [Clostridia bacterium]|nr:N-acetylglucosamine-6-phosphate deacetylase [Deltaproteobacteria bacterium]